MLLIRRDCRFRRRATNRHPRDKTNGNNGLLCLCFPSPRLLYSFDGPALDLYLLHQHKILTMSAARALPPWRTAVMKKLMQPRKKFKPQLAEAAKKKRWNIVAGDLVQVLPGHPESGKQGKVLKVLRKMDRVLIEGVNLGERTVPGDQETERKKVIMERTMHYSNVNLVADTARLQISTPCHKPSSPRQNQWQQRVAVSLFSVTEASI